MLTHLSLFSGIGGLDLAAEMAGFTTVGQCEWADFPTKILEQHWPGVPRWRDIHTLTGESFYERTGLRTVDVISGGFPCQPFSVAGKQRAKDDDRYLWPEMLRVIREIRPAWVLGENVPGIINLALDEVLSSLEAEGYETQTFIIPACGVDAGHKRERCAIVAYTDRNGLPAAAQHGSGAETGDGYAQRKINTGEIERTDQPGHSEDLPGGEAAANADSIGRQRSGYKQIFNNWGGCQISAEGSNRVHSSWENWPPEPGVDRVVDGLPDRVDRVKALGNAVVPQQFYPFFEAMAELLGGQP